MVMTHDEIMALEGAELDAAVAVHVMGWNAQPYVAPGLEPLDIWYRDDGLCAGRVRAGSGPHVGYDEWSPSTDLNHCAEMEEALPHDLRELWGSTLIEVLDSGLLFSIAHAPADARCKAALLALMKEKA